MNIIAIDPSKTSTAMIVNGEIFSYVKAVNAWNKPRTKLSKWFGLCEPLVNFRYIEMDEPKPYSEQEIYKLKKFDEISDLIVEDVQNTIDSSKPTHIVIEGYSYSSVAGHLIDLVGLSTLIRLKLLTICDTVTIITPSEGKLETAKMTYEPTNIGKRIEKWVYLNPKGVKGGSFKKHDMYDAIMDNDNITCKWKDFLTDLYEDIFNAKSVPTPIDDINDAKLFYQILLNKMK